MSLSIFNPLYIPKALEQILNLVIQIGNRMATTQADIDAITATVTTQTTTLKTIATEVQTLVAAQQAGTTLDLTGLQTAVTGSGAEITAIQSKFPPAETPAANPTT